LNRVFADAYFYIAVLNRTDNAHRRAIEFLEFGIAEVVTTVPVLLEVADAMATPTNRAVCAAFLRDIHAQPNTTIRQLDDDLWQRACGLYASRPDKGWSLTDCISFLVMQDEVLTEALTGDRHFQQAGFIALLANNQ
jgi:predicted nucleic acid-binding protein